MPYVTIKRDAKEKQLTWFDVFEDKNESEPAKLHSTTEGTITRIIDYPGLSKYIDAVDIQNMIKRLKEFNQKHKNLYKTDKKTLYRHFTIPKKTGGMRPIDAPCEELQNALRELKSILAEEFGLLHHTSAFAYVEGRCTVDEVRKHQVNESNWFLKTDFSGFFPSTNMDYTMRMLSMIFPTSEIYKDPDGKIELEKALSLGFLNDSLPQGTVLSPFLSNVVSVPMDHYLFNELAHHRYVYTRYADDIHISCVQKFDPNKVIALIRKAIEKFGAPYKIKDEKTHFGSRKGKNFLLGVMLNGENNITVGWKNKQTFRAMTSNLIMDYKNGHPWNPSDVKAYDGLLSYYLMVEKKYFTDLLHHYNNKFHVNIKRIIKELVTTGA